MFNFLFKPVFRSKYISAFVYAVVIYFLPNSIIAQTDYDTQALQAHSKMYNCFAQKDYDCFVNFMAPELIAFVKEKTGKDFIVFLQAELDGMGDIRLIEAKSIKVLQSVLKNGQYQKIIESALHMYQDSIDIVSLSYSLGFSVDGGQWRFMRLNNIPMEALRQIFPMVDENLLLPKNQIFYDKDMKQVLKSYTTQYINEENFLDEGSPNDEATETTP